MNVRNMKRLAEVIRDAGNQYDQGVWYHSYCGTPACVAGFAVACAAADKPERPRSASVLEAMTRLTGQAEQKPAQLIECEAAKWLGLDVNQADKLFSADADIDWPGPYAGRYSMSETNAEAAHVAADLLEDLADGVTTV